MRENRRKEKLHEKNSGKKGNECKRLEHTSKISEENRCQVNIETAQKFEASEHRMQKKNTRVKLAKETDAK